MIPAGENQYEMPGKKIQLSCEIRSLECTKGKGVGVGRDTKPYTASIKTSINRLLIRAGVGACGAVCLRAWGRSGLQPPAQDWTSFSSFTKGLLCARQGTGTELGRDSGKSKIWV